MTPSMLNTADGLRLKVWEVEPDMRYRLKIAVPAHLKDHVSTVLFDLVSARRDATVSDSGLVLLPVDEKHGHKLKVCEFLAAQGLAKLIYQECEKTMTVWALTSEGMAQLRLAYVLLNPRKVIEPQPH
eukprot:13052131-Heterocapsa_arctica.AAC.1